MHEYLNSMDVYIEALDLMEHTMNDLRKEQKLATDGDPAALETLQALRCSESLLSMVQQYRLRCERLVKRMKALQKTVIKSLLNL